MRQIIFIVSLLVLMLALTGCKKNKPNNCFENDPTTRQITDKQATVKLMNNQYYLVEQFAIDTRLDPCYLAQEFRIDNLQVTISGDVKATGQVAGEPCCTDNFVITKIVK